MRKINLKNILNPRLFWEFDYKRLDTEKNKSLIIERVITRGTLNELLSTINYYGVSAIKKEVIGFPQLDNYTFNFLHITFDIPKNNFKCYTKKQLT